MDEGPVILTKQEIGDAIVNYIGIFKKGRGTLSFFPYHISDVDTELHIPDSVMFTLKFVPKGSRIVEHNI